MFKPKDILVTTASSIDGHKINKHLSPISSHVVTGTNLFTDFFASFTDVFGGRSNTYQKQLSSIYNEAIEKLRFTAYEIGANCIIGLKVDLDEISGKGKSMFMVTAMGTAVIADINFVNEISFESKSKPENVSVEDIEILQRKRSIIKQAEAGTLELDEEMWVFISTNKISEIFNFVFNKYPDYKNQTITFLEAFPDDMKAHLVYSRIMEEKNDHLLAKLCNYVDEFELLDFNRVVELFQIDDIKKQKIALKLLTFDKPYYNKDDIEILKSFIEIIKNKFPLKGMPSTKKGMFSTKEKEIWVCECKTSNEIGTNYTLCKNCFKDIYGFTADEVTSIQVISILEEKINLITELI